MRRRCFNFMVTPRTPQEIELMRQAGRIGAAALKAVLEKAKEGVTLKELDKIAEEEILSLGGEPNFKKEEGYFWTTCLNINNEVVHGIPRDIKLKRGDKFSVDVGALLKGWNSDTAWSIIVGEEPDKFLKIGEEALWKGISKAIEGNRIGDISSAIQEVVEGAGYSVVRALVGHGIGKKMHEDPEVPGYGKAGVGLLLKEGMSLAVEVIYAEGGYEVVLDRDGWTIMTEDGSRGGLFEMTIIVGKEKPEVLTDWRKV